MKVNVDWDKNHWIITPFVLHGRKKTTWVWNDMRASKRVWKISNILYSNLKEYSLNLMFSNTSLLVIYKFKKKYYSYTLTFPQFSFQWIFFEMNAVHVSVRVPAAVYSPDDSIGQTRGPALSLTHFHQQPQSCKYEPGSTAQCHPPHSLQVREEKWKNEEKQKRGKEVCKEAGEVELTLACAFHPALALVWTFLWTTRTRC